MTFVYPSVRRIPTPYGMLSVTRYLPSFYDRFGAHAQGSCRFFYKREQYSSRYGSNRPPDGASGHLYLASGAGAWYDAAVEELRRAEAPGRVAEWSRSQV